MRKLIVLMIVLAVASMAVATPVLPLFTIIGSGGGVYTIEMTAPGLQVYGLNIPALSVDTGTLAVGTVSSDFNVSTNDGTLAGGDITGIGGTASGATGPNFALADLYTFTVTSATAPLTATLAGIPAMPFLGSPQLTYYDGSAGVNVDIAGVYQIVPEPMTIALLGLGGLFLRRRK